MQWKVGICPICRCLIRRNGPVDYGVCTNNHPPQDMDLTFEFDEEAQKVIKRTLQRLRRQRRRLGRNSNDVPLTIDSLIAVGMIQGLQKIKKMSVIQVLEACEKYGIS